MKKYSNLEYLRLTGPEKFAYAIASFIFSIPSRLLGLLKGIGRFFKKIGLKIRDIFVNIGRTFVKGGWKTKVSYFIMGFGNIARGQVLRGLLFLVFQIVFIVYMIFWGGHWLSQIGTLGTNQPHYVYNEVLDTDVLIKGDNSFKILLYSVLTIFFIIAFVVTWYINIEQNRISEEILATGKPLKSGKDDLRSLVDDQFHKTLLALPLTGILIFTVMPTFFMILVAFTNYDASHAGDGYSNLFTWVGLSNFNELLSFSDGKNAYSIAFGEVLTWTLIWAFFATFTNYFLGMFVAIMINKKGIKLKKMW